MSFLRKQESRRLCACCCVPAGQAGIQKGEVPVAWIPACAGMTPLSWPIYQLASLSHQGRGGLLHSANVLLGFFLDSRFRGSDTGWGF